MPSKIITRSITSDEKTSLENAQTISSPNIREELSMLLSVFISFMIIVVLLWFILALLGSAIFDLQFGLNSRYSPWILSILILIGVGLCGSELFRQMKWKKNKSYEIEQDIENEEVEELQLEILDSKCLQEIEHGGVFYFLRTREGRIFVMFDYDSPGIVADGRNPFDSEFKPLNNLHITRTLKSKIILNQRFLGEPVKITSIGDMMAEPSDWPEAEEFCSIRWDEIEEKYA